MSGEDKPRAFEHLGDEHVYQGRIWRVVTGRFRSRTGEDFNRDIVRSPGAVGVVPILSESGGENQVVLVRQYRAAFDDYVIEIPAGMRDVPGEEIHETAHRELLEETGFRAGSLAHLHSFYPSPGMTDAVLHIFMACELASGGRRAQGPEESDMEVIRLGMAEAVEMAIDGRIRDAKSVIGILLAHRTLSSH